MKRDLLRLADLGADGIRAILEASASFEHLRGDERHPKSLAGRTAALVFDLPSTRTRLSLEVATVELGGHPLVLTAQGSQTSRGEPIEDTARVLGRMVDLVACRTGSQAEIEALARACDKPVINALTREAHPLQVLADLYAVKQAKSSLQDLRYAWIGDSTNVARSWIEAASLLGLHLTIASPPGFGPPAEEIAAAGGHVQAIEDPRAAASRADVILTDGWVSMGFEADAEVRRKAFAPYRVSRDLLAIAARGAVVLHCLPAHRGEEIDAEVIDGPQSLVWEAVSARLHTAKAVLAWAAGETPGSKLA